MDIIEEARRFRAKVELLAQNITDEEADDNIDFFPNWEVGVEYKADFKIRYNGVMYKVLQDHTSQEDWTPDVAVSLYVKCHQQDPQDEFPPYEQPTAENPYMKGDKVTFEGKHYICLIDNCVWSPTDYPQGWEEVE